MLGISEERRKVEENEDFTDISRLICEVNLGLLSPKTRPRETGQVDICREILFPCFR